MAQEYGEEGSTESIRVVAIPVTDKDTLARVTDAKLWSAVAMLRQ